MHTPIEYFILYSTQLIQVLVFTAGCYFFGVSVFGWVKRKEDDLWQYPAKTRFAAVIAAHNEERVIGHVIDSLKKQNYPRELFDIFVIADNCTDKTEEIARKHGAIVYSRFDNEKRGKGFALEWMFSILFKMEKQYDAVAVFDADNVVSSNFLREMNKQHCKGHKIVQGYIDSKNPYDTWITASYSVAFWMANRIFQLPRYYMGLSCSLCGTGFSVDTRVLEKIGWGATCLTEDLEFTMKLVLNNMKIAWAHNAVVYDEKPLTLAQSWRQRVRWMQGHADCASRYLRPLFEKAFKDGNLACFDCAVYLFQPIRFILIGFINVLLWFQTIFPESPFYSIKYFFPAWVWMIFVILQFFYGPGIVIAEKGFNPKIILSFLIYPFYCLTWVPIAIQGFLSKENKVWYHTVHTREISISEIEKTARAFKPSQASRYP